MLVYYLTALLIKSLKPIDRASWAPRKITCPRLFYPGGHLNVLVLGLCISLTSALSCSDSPAFFSLCSFWVHFDDQG